MIERYRSLNFDVDDRGVPDFLRIWGQLDEVNPVAVLHPREAVELGLILANWGWESGA